LAKVFVEPREQKSGCAPAAKKTIAPVSKRQTPWPLEIL